MRRRSGKRSQFPSFCLTDGAGQRSYKHTGPGRRRNGRLVRSQAANSRFRDVAGKVGSEFTVDEGYQFARETGLLLLSAVKHTMGTLNKVSRVIRVFGMVNCSPDFKFDVATRAVPRCGR